MLKTFEVLNVKCGGCASTLIKSLKDDFGDVDLNLDLQPRTITLDITDNQLSKLREKLISLGYPMIDENLSKLSKVTTTAKSFVSCAIGKMNN